MVKSVNGILLVLAAVLLVPLVSYSAGLGKLTVKSSLGQPLDAEIEVVALQPGEDLNVRLASREAYRDAGLDLSPALEGARFAVERRDGRTVIRVMTTQPVNDPFMTVMVELQWSTGKLARQYTVLVDPVEYRTATTPAPTLAAPQIATPPVAAAASASAVAPMAASSAAPPTPLATAPSAVPALAVPMTVTPTQQSVLAPAAAAIAPAAASAQVVVAQPPASAQSTGAAQAIAPAAVPAQLKATEVMTPSAAAGVAATRSEPPAAPPATASVTPEPVSPPVAAAPAPVQSTRVAEAAPVLSSTPTAASTQTESARTAPVPAAPIARTVTAPVAPTAPSPLQTAAPSTAAAPAQRVVDASDTYRIKRGDTLGGIARRWKPDGVTHEQMLMGLYQTNRPVFIRDNINLIRAGATVFIPGREDVLAISAADAARQVRTHMADFGKYRRDYAASVGAGSARAQQAQREVISRRVGVKRSTRAM